MNKVGNILYEIKDNFNWKKVFSDNKKNHEIHVPKYAHGT